MKFNEIPWISKKIMLSGYHPAYTCIKVKGGWGMPHTGVWNFGRGSCHILALGCRGAAGMPDHCHQGTWKAIGYIGRGGLLVYWGMGGEDFGYTSRKEEVPLFRLRKVFRPRINVNLRESMELNENPGKSMRIHENQWKSKKLQENQWNYMKINEIQWNSMNF